MPSVPNVSGHYCPSSEKMKITAIGHAGFWVDCGTDKILCDPWFSLAGAYAASWFQFPGNAHLELDSFEASTHLYLSHWHQDHFDPEFLAARSPEFKQRVQVIVAQFYAPKLQDWLKANGYAQVQVLKSGTEFITASGTVLFLQTDENPSFADSAITIAAQGQTFVNTNDCKLSIQQELAILSRFGPITAMSAQFSGATFHPTCYDYPFEKKQAISQQRRTSKYRRILESLERLQVQYYFPAAGPACFLTEDLQPLNLNPETVFSIPDEFTDWLRQSQITPAAKFILLCPGDSLTIPAGELERVSDLVSRFQSQAYIAELAQERQTAIQAELLKFQRPLGDLLSDAKAHFQALIDNVPALGKLANTALIIQITGDLAESFVVYLPTGEILDCLPNLPAEQLPQRLTLTLSAFWLRALVDKLISWEDFVLSFRLMLKAEPDVFYEPVVAFLQLESPSEREAFVQLFTKYKQAASARITRVYQGKTIEYDRYCPHNGEDLSKAPIENGEIVCLRHFWRFAAADGKGTNNNCSLNVRVISTVE